MKSALALGDGHEAWVLTTNSNERDLLRWCFGFVRLVDRSSGTTCETAYRVKGLHFEHVILVADSEDDPEQLRQLLSSGVNRALKSLMIIGPQAVIDHA